MFDHNELFYDKLSLNFRALESRVMVVEKEEWEDEAEEDFDEYDAEYQAG